MKKFKRAKAGQQATLAPTAAASSAARNANASVQTMVNLVHLAMREERAVPLSANAFAIVFPALSDMAAVLRAQRKAPADEQPPPVVAQTPPSDGDAPLFDLASFPTAPKPVRTYYPFESIAEMQRVLDTFCSETATSAPHNHILWNLIKCILPESTYVRILSSNIVLPRLYDIFARTTPPPSRSPFACEARRLRETYGRSRAYALNPFAADVMLRRCAAAKCGAMAEQQAAAAAPSQSPTTATDEKAFMGTSCQFVYDLWPLVAMIRRNYPIAARFDDRAFWAEPDHEAFQHFLVDFYYPLVGAKLKDFLAELDAQYDAHLGALTPEQRDDFAFALPDLCTAHVELRGSMHPYHHLQAVAIPALHDYIGNTHLACVVLMLEMAIRLFHSAKMQDFNVASIFVHHVVAVLRVALHRSVLKYLSAHHDHIDCIATPRTLDTYLASPAIFLGDAADTEGEGYRYVFAPAADAPEPRPVTADERATTPSSATSNEFYDFYAQSPLVVARQLGFLTPATASLQQVADYRFPRALRFFQMSWQHFVDVNQLLFGEQRDTPSATGVPVVMILSSLATLAVCAESNAFPGLPAVTRGLDELASAPSHAARVAFTRYFMLLIARSVDNGQPFADIRVVLAHGVGANAKTNRALHWYNDKLMSGTRKFASPGSIHR